MSQSQPQKSEAAAVYVDPSTSHRPLSRGLQTAE